MFSMVLLHDLWTLIDIFALSEFSIIFFFLRKKRKKYSIEKK